MRAAARRFPALALAAGLAALVMAGCSNTPASSTTSSAPGGNGSSTTTSTTGSGTTAVATCPASSLAVTVAGSAGAAGTLELTFELKNSSATTCQLDGFPGAQLYGPGAVALPTDVVRAGTYGFTNFAPTPVDLAPGATAFFNLGYSDVQSGTTTCSQATSMWITPPNDVDHAVVTRQLDACDGGRLTVSPVFSQASAGTHTTAPPTSG